MVRPMAQKIEPDLFARLMRLTPKARTDLLEYIGQSPVHASEIARLTNLGPVNSGGAQTPLGDGDRDGDLLPRDPEP